VLTFGIIEMVIHAIFDILGFLGETISQLFCILAHLGFFCTTMPFAVSFQKIDPLLDAIIIGAEATHSGATFFGASIFIRGSWCVEFQGVGAIDLGADPLYIGQTGPLARRQTPLLAA
jgi:hypothetical protein